MALQGIYVTAEQKQIQRKLKALREKRNYYANKTQEMDMKLQVARNEARRKGLKIKFKGYE